MQPAIENYTELILAQSSLLRENQQFNESQSRAITLIDTYTKELAVALQSSQNLTEAEMHSFMRHRLLNILTPVVGYIEMLADGWIGALQPDQAEPVEIILHAVRDLMALIQNQGTQSLAS